MHYIAGTAGRRYLLRRNATGRVKISLSNWTACPGRRYDAVERLFIRFTRPFSSPLAVPPRERRATEERGREGEEKQRLIAYRPFVSKLEPRKAQFLRGRFVPRHDRNIASADRCSLSKDLRVIIAGAARRGAARRRSGTRG